MKNKEKTGPSGHRQRLKERFLKTGFDGFHDYEKLELALFYAIPRIDTKPVAKMLIGKFGGLAGVMDADRADLESIAGMGASSALFIKMMRALMADYHTAEALNNPDKITTISKLVEFLRSVIGGSSNEVLYGIFLNPANEVLYSGLLGEGTVTEVAAYPRRVVETALKYRASSVIIAHNHPGGVAEPSRDDLNITEKIKKALEIVGISFQEHIILAGSEYYSFKKKGIV